MSVILTALVEGEGSSRQVTLPSPRTKAPVTVDDNRKTNRLAAGGGLRVFTLGPPRWQIERTFECLTELEIKAFWLFWVGIDGPATPITYQSQVPTGAPGVPLISTPTCVIVGQPKEVKVSHNQWDLTVTFEHSKHPDSETNRDVIV